MLKETPELAAQPEVVTGSKKEKVMAVGIALVGAVDAGLGMEMARAVDTDIKKGLGTDTETATEEPCGAAVEPAKGQV